MRFGFSISKKRNAFIPNVMHLFLMCTVRLTDLKEELHNLLMTLKKSKAKCSPQSPHPCCDTT